MNFEKYFKRYESLVSQVDSVFEKVKGDYDHLITCGPGCSDCCNAVFDITLVEALYIKEKFDEKFSGKLKHELTEKANKVDRKVHKLKKAAYNELKNGADGKKIIDQVSKEKIRCPLLGEDDRCVMYEHRPIACRVYGIPTASGGEVHTCGLSKFDRGETYPTLNMEAVYAKLYAISNDLVKGINSKHKKMGEMIFPLSMTLITSYNDEYLGIGD